MKKLLHKLMADQHCADAIRKLDRLEKRLPSSESRFAIPFVFRGKGGFRSIRPRQNPSEIESLYRTICQLKPQNVLEIGTAKGGTLYLWPQAATDNATIVSVDLPGGAFGGGYAPYRSTFYQQFARSGQRLVLLRKDSHDAQTRDQIKSLFDHKPLDFLFIDGDHTYEGVKSDFLGYGPMVRPGGLIGFHDILPQPWSPQTQVYKLWEQLAKHHEVTQWVDSRSKRLVGIGLLVVPEKGIHRVLD